MPPDGDEERGLELETGAQVAALVQLQWTLLVVARHLIREGMDSAHRGALRGETETGGRI
jgi:hypothetical protein